MNSTTNDTGRRRQGVAVWVMGAVMALGAAAGTAAFAQPEPSRDGPARMAPRPPMPPAGGMMFPMMGRGLERMLKDINASDAQRTQIRQIADAAGADLRKLHEANRGQQEKAMALFMAPTIDADAAEAQRQQMLKQHDAASKRMLQAMLDIGRVLTPEQRGQLAEKMKQRGERMREHRGHHEPRPDAPPPAGR